MRLDLAPTRFSRPPSNGRLAPKLYIDNRARDRLSSPGVRAPLAGHLYTVALTDRTTYGDLENLTTESLRLTVVESIAFLFGDSPASLFVISLKVSPPEITLVSPCPLAFHRGSLHPTQAQDLLSETYCAWCCSLQRPQPDQSW